ncbi:hypothetical protein [Streptomyces rubellomurinus]|uniref:hypothetical protein n=1 Tax=Streptomyces rubellomurinus (strain ATCC 31215) TaxID=359131 RepID=UPI0012FF5462|nr:hypothetical protein [Streptomyces rubellomurinus]
MSPVAREPRHGWREVPVQRLTFGAPSLVTDPTGFRGGLVSWQDPSFLGPLGHLVHAAAPGGTGYGLAEPVGVGPRAAAASAAVQRVPDGTADVVPDRAPDVVAPLAGARPVPGGAPEVVVPAAPRAAMTVVARSVELPVRTLPATPLRPVVQRAGRPLPEEPDPVAAEPPAEAPAPVEPPAPDADAPSTSEAPAPLTAGERPLLGDRPMTSSSSAPPQRVAAPESPMVADPPPPRPRLGLGAPLSSPPAVQRSAGPVPSPPQNPRRAARVGAPIDAVPPTVQRAGQADPVGSPAASPPAADGSGPAPSGSRAGEAVAPVQRSVSPSSEEAVAPLLGDAPLVPQALRSGDAPAAEAGTPGTTPLPAPSGPRAGEVVAPVQRSVSPSSEEAAGPLAPLLGDAPLVPQALRTGDAPAEEEAGAPGTTPLPPPSGSRAGEAVAPVQRSVSPSSEEAAGPLAPLLGDAPLVPQALRTGDAPAAENAGAPGTAALPPPAPAAPLPLPVQRVTSMEPEFVGVVDPAVSAAPGAAATGLLGEHGLELRSAPTPRATGAGEQAPAAGPATELPVVPVAWAPPVHVEPTGEVRRQAWPASVQRSAAGGGAVHAPQPLTGRDRPALPLQGLSAQYRTAVQAVPVPPSGVRQQAPVARPGGAPADAGTVAVAAGIAQRMPDGSVLFAPPSPPPGRRAGTELPIQRAESPPTFEPHAAPAAEPPADPPAGPPVQRAESPPSSVTPPHPPPPVTPAESTDELVRRLIDPLGRLLRAELRLDRERAGRRFDTHY